MKISKRKSLNPFQLAIGRGAKATALEMLAIIQGTTNTRKYTSEPDVSYLEHEYIFLLGPEQRTIVRDATLILIEYLAMSSDDDAIAEMSMVATFLWKSDWFTQSSSPQIDRLDALWKRCAAIGNVSQGVFILLELARFGPMRPPTYWYDAYKTIGNLSVNAVFEGILRTSLLDAFCWLDEESRKSSWMPLLARVLPRLLDENRDEVARLVSIDSPPLSSKMQLCIVDAALRYGYGYITQQEPSRSTRIAPMDASLAKEEEDILIQEIPGNNTFRDYHELDQSQYGFRELYTWYSSSVENTVGTTNLLRRAIVADG